MYTNRAHPEQLFFNKQERKHMDFTEAAAAEQQQQQKIKNMWKMYTTDFFLF